MLEGKGGLSHIHNTYHLLSKKQKSAADFILRNPERIALMTMRELSEICKISEATIVRFLKKLGYDNYQELRVDVARERTFIRRGAIEAQLADGYQGIGPEDSAEEIKNKVIYAAVQAIRETENLVDDRMLARAAEILLNAGQILCYGSGGSQAIIQDAYHKLLRLGLPVFCDANYHLARIKANSLNTGDAAVLLSHTGESRDLLSCAEQARKQGAAVIGITSYLDSSLAQLSDLVFYSSRISLKYYTDAMTSRLAQMTILDMIYLTVRLRLGEEGMKRITRAKEAIAELKAPKKR